MDEIDDLFKCPECGATKSECCFCGEDEDLSREILEDALDGLATEGTLDSPNP